MTRPDFSIVVPVLYEEDTITGLLEHIRRIDVDERCEVIVVDGDPDCGTIGRVEDDRVHTLTSRPWRSRQMNAGAAAACGDTLIFLHADTRLPLTALADIDAVLRDDGCAGGAFRLVFDSDRWVYRLMSAFVTIRSRWNRLPFGDQSIFIRRKAFERMGGYREIPVMEDVELVRRLRRAGERLTIVDSSVRTSCRRMEAEGLTKRVFQNWMMQTLYNAGVSPERLVKFYSENYRLQPDRAGRDIAWRRRG
jgi:rSAM/selenodomain-associated transferase 2